MFSICPGSRIGIWNNIWYPTKLGNPHRLGYNSKELTTFPQSWKACSSCDGNSAKYTGKAELPVHLVWLPKNSSQETHSSVVFVDQGITSWNDRTINKIHSQALESRRKSNLGFCLQRYSPNHQILCRRQEQPSETFLPFTAYGIFSIPTEILPDKTENGSASSLVNSTVNINMWNKYYQTDSKWHKYRFT